MLDGVAPPTVPTCSTTRSPGVNEVGVTAKAGEVRPISDSRLYLSRRRCPFLGDGLHGFFRGSCVPHL